ncbi:MAG: DEAD/DEAH box helicase [Nanoarchaeota archaeon]|nr:DEAD/DEAH box helicase [Nanoarchaeota archaeon]
MENKFEKLKISKELKRAIEDMGILEMFPIQLEAIPKILKGVDIIGQAQTGTGKTLAFAIPIVERVNPSEKSVQAIVITPTRELAVQVSNEIKKLSKYKKLNVLSVYGGVSIDKQAEALRRGVHVVVGTPGRIIDQINRGNLKLNKIKILVLDEADRMLDMGFIDDIRTILQDIPKDRQTLLFSATMPEIILNLAKDYMHNPEVIKVSEDELTVKDIKQFYCEVDYRSKIDALKNILTKQNIKSAIIFCNTKISVDKLVNALRKMHFKVDALHGNFSQARRNKVLSNFRQGKFNILVATDVAARGLDIKGVSHVINYNVPRDPKDYVHRIGRTGRAGKGGVAITLVTERDMEYFRSIEWLIDEKIPKMECLPKGHKIKKGSFQKRSPNRYALGNY